MICSLPVSARASIRGSSTSRMKSEFRKFFYGVIGASAGSLPRRVKVTETRSDNAHPNGRQRHGIALGSAGARNLRNFSEDNLPIPAPG
jgi:hypothetical protein